MGVYVFSWKVLRKYLKDDNKKEDSDHDFGKNIIPEMLEDGRKMQAYRFKGYWRDVGTLASLHQANMDICLGGSELDLYFGANSTRIFTEDTFSVPQYVGREGSIVRSIANQGSAILGTVDSCVISNEVIIKEGAVCTRCVIMEGAIIGHNVKINNAIVAPGVYVEDNQEINLNSDEIVLVSKGGKK